MLKSMSNGRYEDSKAWVTPRPHILISIFQRYIAGVFFSTGGFILVSDYVRMVLGACYW